MRSLVPLLIVLATACASPPAERLAELYAEAAADVGGDVGNRDSLREGSVRRTERVLEAIEAFGALAEPTPLDRLHAACVMLDSEVGEHLEIARDLALAAAHEGDERGFPIAAEATDRWLVSQELMQWYGTQYAYSPILGRWDLYPVDPTVSDERRRAMGVPSMDEARARVDELNAD